MRALEVVCINQVQYGTFRLERGGYFPYRSMSSGSVFAADVDVVALGVDVHSHLKGFHGTGLTDDSYLACRLPES